MSRHRAAAALVVVALGLAGCVEVTLPPPGNDPASERPGASGPGAGGTDQNGYAFVRTRGNGQPVRWSTCEPIRYVVRPAQEPEGGRELLRESMDRITEASGLEFSFAGTTDEPPRSNRQPYDSERYGDVWSPVLVAWSDPDELARLKGRQAGFGGPVQVRQSGLAPRYVSGIVVIDADQVTSMGEESMRAVILHELAHVVGLAHVDDRGQLMNPVQYGRAVTSLQGGDLAGLEALGKGKCYEPIEPQEF